MPIHDKRGFVLRVYPIGKLVLSIDLMFTVQNPS